MCGIFGQFSPAGVDEGSCRKSLAMLSHRGPDGEGIRISPDRRLFLGHRRLKIIDLSDQSAQPMSTPDGRWTIIYNGEIMNYQELRRELGDRWSWRTRGDTELLLALWALHGPACLDKLVGMFAFAIHDSHFGEITLARDRFGIKPLYWCDLPGHGIAFASEIPPLLRFLPKILPDESTIRTYLEQGLYDHGENTFFRGINSLSPGVVLHCSLQKPTKTLRPWYLFPDRIPDLKSADSGEIEREAERLITQAVSSHLVADVAVGLNISGGVDSAMLARTTLDTLGQAHLFTQDYAGYSELPWIKEIAEGGTLHVSTLSSQGVAEVVEKTVASQAEPFGGIFVCGYNFLYQAARANDVTVLLDGNGVDEAFLGYRRYHQMYVAGALDPRERESRRKDFIGFWGQAPKEPSARAAIDGTDGLKPDAIMTRLKENTFIDTTKKFGFQDPVREAAAADLLSAKIPRGLRFNDRVSMANSRELRVPFLDHRLVEFAFAIPIPLLLNEKGSKAMFRRILSRKAPPSVAFASKRSVQSSQREWLATEWRPWVESILMSKSFANRGWVDPAVANSLYEDYLTRGGENSFFIWQWINLELWARTYLDASQK